MEKCASEWETCNCAGFVRFGNGALWSPIVRIEGDVACNYQNPIFGGDPAPGQSKHCECAPISSVTSTDQLKVKFIRGTPVGCVKLADINGELIPPNNYIIQKNI